MNSKETKVVLVVDDHADSRDLLRAILEGYDYQVVEASDGHEAISKAFDSRPDLILMDIAMPELDGIEAIRRIKRAEETSHIPVIGITAQTDEYIEDALDARFDQVIRKPISIDALEPILTDYLEAA